MVTGSCAGSPVSPGSFCFAERAGSAHSGQRYDWFLAADLAALGPVRLGFFLAGNFRLRRHDDRRMFLRVDTVVIALSASLAHKTSLRMRQDSSTLSVKVISTGLPTRSITSTTLASCSSESILRITLAKISSRVCSFHLELVSGLTWVAHVPMKSSVPQPSPPRLKLMPSIT